MKMRFLLSLPPRCCSLCRTGAVLAAEAGALHRAVPAGRRDRHLGAAARRRSSREIWGQTVVIENRGGAGGGVGAAEAARATPDGYTLFFPSGSVVTANQHIYAKMNYDPEKDFVPVTNVVSGPQVLTVPAKSPFKTVKDLIDCAKAQSRQAQLRPRRHRLADAPRRREFRLPGEDPGAGRALQGRRPRRSRGAGGRRDRLRRRPTSRPPSATSTAAACARSA